VTVWTISAQEGTGGTRVATELAAAAEVPLLDREALTPLAREIEPALPRLDELEARFGRFTMLSLSTAVAVGSAEAFKEVDLRHRLPELARAGLGEAARASCVIYVPAAFAALADHPSAVHVRLRAPLERRIASYQREHVVDRRCAEKALKHADHRMHAWVKSLYHVDIDDPQRFSLVLDTSRFSADRIVEILLAAAGAQAVPVAA
jgi:cytidylate kinase